MPEQEHGGVVGERRSDGGAVYKALVHKAIADDDDLKLFYTTPSHRNASTTVSE
ncbi:hypothetical protein [Actinomadura sp. KC06]|uniref:hypothetical protein n=1 Tax=Actinomadura sp. KC06 TaxID=2530369 RepID=UPI00140503CB|nr:hypothetical protein [Actinomadura sp. KC06]